MNRFKGPELKLSELRVPQVLRDLYWDLRDRRLLPLIALVLAAILATPFLLGGGGAGVERTPAPLGGGSPQETSLTVLPAEPGLREPGKRLDGLSPKDPFRAHYTAPPVGNGSTQGSEPATGSGSSGTAVNVAPESGGSGGGSAEGGSSGPAPEPTPAPEPSPSGGGSPSAGGGGDSSGGHSTDEAPQGGTLYTLEVTLQITRIETKPDGSVDRKGPTVYKDIQAPAPLPGEKTPVITYLGMGSKGKVPMFLVSNEVTGIFGETKCISGAKTCQLLVLEEGFPVTFVYGENDVRYKINLLKAEPIVTGHA
ncbi:MAG TPA: hypothetical protein VFN85_08760 [Solirubrobacterales bacterium]|nr:hypothetical protein [Solirubrobacterales bacterium]